jgi:hypothetical protein
MGIKYQPLALRLETKARFDELKRKFSPSKNADELVRWLLDLAAYSRLIWGLKRLPTEIGAVVEHLICAEGKLPFDELSPACEISHPEIVQNVTDILNARDDKLTRMLADFVDVLKEARKGSA